MTADIVMRPKSRVTLPIGVCQYSCPVEGGYLFTSEQTGRNHVVKHAQFQTWFADRKVRIHGTKPLNAYDAEGLLAPGQVLSDVEKARVWYCRRWDLDPCPKSVGKLDAFVRYYAAKAASEGVLHRPSAGALRRALSSRGEMGHRPTSAMLTRTGKVARAPHVHPAVAGLLNRCAVWFWAERGRDKNDAHTRLEVMVPIYNRLFRRGDGVKPIEAPSKETVRVWINARACKETVRVKHGKRAAKEQFQGSVPTLTASRVLEKVAIDATRADSWCVWRESNDMPLGRPTLYTAVDVRSRMPIAWFFTFEPPSVYGLMGLIKRIVTPNDHGIWGKPRTIVLDNAWENWSVSAVSACSDASISTEFAPIDCPEYKAVVERMFGTINSKVLHKLPGGAVPAKPHAMKALGLDPEKTASVMLEDLDEIMKQALWEVYAKDPQGGIKEIPMVVWDKHMKQYGREVVGDLQTLLLNFGQVETVTLTRSGVVTRDGLRFSHTQHVTELLEDLGKQEPMRTRRKGSAKAVVKIVIDPEDISKVTVWNPVRRKPVILDNVHLAFARECRSRWEYRMLKSFVHEECVAFSTEEDRMKRHWKLRQMIDASSPEIKKTNLRRYRALLAKQGPKPEGNLVMAAQVQASVDGREPVDEVEAVLAAVTAAGDGLPMKGARRGGQAAVDKQKATVAARKAEKDRAARSASVDVDDEAGTLRSVVEHEPEPFRARETPAPRSTQKTKQDAPEEAPDNPFAALDWVKKALDRGGKAR